MKTGLCVLGDRIEHVSPYSIISREKPERSAGVKQRQIIDILVFIIIDIPILADNESFNLIYLNSS